ncbi:MAG: hypothetical protein KatS3mg127_1307 [Silanimonas sp.]|nr:MAG: hypothetical protein KatS3mg127_1307 [Silanimonas sp.]
MAAPAPLPTTGRRDRFCHNCGVPLLGDYCHACGQATRGLVRPLPQLGSEFLDSLFNLDSRLLRTLPALLLQPGRLSIEYLGGRRARYVSPMRLFVFLCIATFFAAGLATPAFDITEQDERSSVPGAATPQGRHGPGEAADSLGPAFILSGEADAPVINFNGRSWHATDNPLALDWLPAAGNQWLNDRVVQLSRNWARIREDPQLLSSAFYWVSGILCGFRALGLL